jgi:hypothetical protein
MKKGYLIGLFVLQLIVGYSQDSIVKKDSLQVHFRGYMDVYLGTHTAATTNQQAPMMVNSAICNQPSINCGFAEMTATYQRFRSTLSLGLGSYFQTNYSAEHGLFRNIQAANLGINVWKKRGIWLDAGVLASPYTNETAISIDQLVYTRSLASEYVPYFMTGINLTIPMGTKWHFNVACYNGWQHIADNNKQPAAGFQLTYQPTKKHLFSVDGFYGDENSSSTPFLGMRTFLDAYWTYTSDKWSATTCFYAGKTQHFSAALNANLYWFQGNATLRYTTTKNWRYAGRIEFFNDEQQVMLPLSNNGIAPQKVISETISIGKMIAKKFLLRAECRHFLTKSPYFIQNGHSQQSAFWMTCSLAFWLD